jgi:hypothetical protein
LYDFRFQHSCFYKLTHIKRLALCFEGADSSAPQIPTTKSHNVQKANTRGRSSSRKRPLSGSDEQMKPPASRQRSQSVTRKVPNPGSDKQVTFKTQGQSFDMCKLVETTMLKPEIIQTVTDCERCRLEGGFICSSEPDKGRLREELLPRVLAFCTLCDLVVGI